MSLKKPLLKIIVFLSFIQLSCKPHQNKDADNLAETNKYPETIIFNAPGLNPEGIEYNPENKLFYLSAINQTPSILGVNLDGSSQIFSNDKEHTSKASFGLQVDLKNNHLLACINGPKIGNLNIYNLKSGDLEHVVNLSNLLPEKNQYQINDLAVDDKNNIYVTGRLEDAIYKIDSNLKASVLFQKEGFTKPNGIVYHPDGYLLVSFSHNQSSLVKIPVDNPGKSEIITIKNYNFIGFDGMVLNEKKHLIGVTFNPDANGEHFLIELSSNDDWESTTIVNSKKINKSTTVAQVKLNLYYVLNQDWKNRDAENWILEKVEFK